MEHKTANAENVIKEFKEFERLASEYGHFGATDTEPEEVYQWQIQSFLEGELDKDLPKLEAWQLFSSKEGWEDIANKLTKQLAVIRDLIILLPLGEVDQVKRYTKDNYWRTS